MDNPRLSRLWALACLLSGSTGAQGCLLRLAGRGVASRAGTGWGAAVTTGERQAASGVSSAAPVATFCRTGLLHRETSLPTTSSVKGGETFSVPRLSGVEDRTDPTPCQRAQPLSGYLGEAHVAGVGPGGEVDSTVWRSLWGRPAGSLTCRVSVLEPSLG